MQKVQIFTDGSSLGNPGLAGWSAIVQVIGCEYELKGGDAEATNNQMELRAAIEGIKSIKEPSEITIVSDSQYVVKGINEWLKGWIERDFKKVENSELWHEYLGIVSQQKHKVTATWVRGHNGHLENERADKIAKAEAEKMAKLPKS